MYAVRGRWRALGKLRHFHAQLYNTLFDAVLVILPVALSHFLSFTFSLSLPLYSLSAQPSCDKKMAKREKWKKSRQLRETPGE